MEKWKTSALVVALAFAVHVMGEEPPPPAAPAKDVPKQAGAPADKSGAKSGSAIEKIHKRLAIEKNNFVKQDQEYSRRIEEQVDKIEKLLNSRDDWTRDTDGEGKMNGLGEIETLRLRATFFAIERGFRKEVEREIKDLIKLVREWSAFHKEAKERLRILELEERVAVLEQKEAEGAAAVPVRKEDFEYYEVKSESTLQQISGLPDVYGDPTLWRLLYNANKDKISDPDKPVPAGTVLVVPEMLK